MLDSILRSLDSSFGHDLSLKFPMGCLSGSHSSLLGWLSTRYQSQFTIFSQPFAIHSRTIRNFVLSFTAFGAKPAMRYSNEGRYSNRGALLRWPNRFATLKRHSESGGLLLKQVAGQHIGAKPDEEVNARFVGLGPQR